MSQTPDEQPIRQEFDTKAMELIRTSGILNPNITLEKIMELTQQLTTISGDGTVLRVCTFIYPSFIYRQES